MAKSKKFLTKDAFLGQSNSLRKDVCDLPELGGSVWVRELGGKSLLVYNERIKQLQKDGSEVSPSQALDLMALLISLTVCDEDGNLMFTESDVARLAESGISTLFTLSEKAMEVSGISTAAIAEVTSNLKNAQTSASTAS